MIRQFSSFLIVGVVNTAVSYAVFVLLNLIMPYWIAYSIAFVCGIVVAAVGSSRFVFYAQLTIAPFLGIATTYVASYFIGVFTLYGLVDHAHLHPALAIFAVIAITVPLNFFGTRLALLRRPNSPSEMLSHGES